MKSKVGLKITIVENGPYRVEGSVPLAKQTIVTNDDGDSVEWRQSDEFETKVTYNLCRCGHSASQPFCDGSHTRVGFDGTETASRVPYLQEADLLRGPTLNMTDLPSHCADARFCDAGGSAWDLVAREGAKAAALTTRQAQMCPSGRLVARDRETNVALEPEFEPSIGLVEGPSRGSAGPR